MTHRERSQPVYLPRCNRSPARHDDGMAHPSPSVTTLPASLCWCDRLGPERVIGARVGRRVNVTDDTSVGTMDGELTSAND
ncbi:hypothetical protein [Haloarcula amylolytica]|uniref:hypothetical protein n=1 Tax=Haloarcula amylolytica TaxID=396317 RepID=UPI003C731352